MADAEQRPPHDGDDCHDIDRQLDDVIGDLNDARMALVRAGIPAKWRVEGEDQDCPTADMVRDLHRQRDRLHAFAYWLAAMDSEPGSLNEHRRTVTLDQIIERARDAMSSPS